ncbi:hypothetical protein ACIBCN_10165 [Nocardia sp. NPDC051052]|uniref:hypothetical protein n=1 Tax=Nocardia sp. NPDC051052 TaxID=3364322 RepID=UPI0037897536
MTAERLPGTVGVSRPESTENDPLAAPRLASGELYLSGVQLIPASAQMTLAVDKVEAIVIELPGLPVVTSTLDTSAAMFELQSTDIETSATKGSVGAQSFAGAGLREGPAPAGIHPEFPDAPVLFGCSVATRLSPWQPSAAAPRPGSLVQH